MAVRCTTMRAVALLLLIASACIAGSEASSNCFKEKNGNIVVQVESAKKTGQWRRGSSVRGFTGTGYYTWFGGDEYTFRGKGVLNYRVCSPTGGTYKVNLWSMRLKKHGMREDEGNDCWIKDGGVWKKLFTHFGSDMNTWKLSQEFDVSHQKIAPMIQLKKGCHPFQIAARSSMFSLDRIILQKSGRSLDMKSKGSTCDSSSGSPGSSHGGKPKYGGKFRRPKCQLGFFAKNRGKSMRLLVKNNKKAGMKLWRKAKGGKVIAMGTIKPGRMVNVKARRLDFFAVTNRSGVCVRRTRIKKRAPKFYMKI